MRYAAVAALLVACDAGAPAMLAPAAAGDLAVAASPDIGARPDATAAPDLLTAPDLTESPDLMSPPDLQVMCSMAVVGWGNRVGGCPMMNAYTCIKGGAGHPYACAECGFPGQACCPNGAISRKCCNRQKPAGWICENECGNNDKC